MTVRKRLTVTLDVVAYEGQGTLAGQGPLPELGELDPEMIGHEAILVGGRWFWADPLGMEKAAPTDEIRRRFVRAVFVDARWAEEETE